MPPNAFDINVSSINAQSAESFDQVLALVTWIQPVTSETHNQKPYIQGVAKGVRKPAGLVAQVEVVHGFGYIKVTVSIKLGREFVAVVL